MSADERRETLNADLITARAMAARGRTYAEYTEARRLNPLATDDPGVLAAESEAARRDVLGYETRAREIEAELAAIDRAERERRRAEARELARALVIDAKKCDQAGKTFARYEKPVRALRDRLATEYADVLGANARYVAQKGHSHDMALAAAGILSDLAQSRGPVSPLSYAEQIAPFVADLLLDEGDDE